MVESLKIIWVSHASFIVESEGIKLITDPWLGGKLAFNDGWALLSETKLTYDDFRSITHIWFSHEHPDHFSPADLKSIPAEYRSKITILFQQTSDKKVLRFCEKLGFKSCIELVPHQWKELHPHFKLLCGPVPGGDSWLAINASGKTILNLNDCVLQIKDEIESIANAVKNIDVLLTQFSYANWVGNKKDEKYAKLKAQEKLKAIEAQIEMLRPKFTIPFASFVWFCHEENFHMNRFVNSVQTAFDFINHHTPSSAVVLYPGDEWTPGIKHDSSKALASYKDDALSKINSSNLLASQRVELKDIYAAAGDFLNNLRKKNAALFLYRQRAVNFYLTDHHKALRLSPRRGLREIDLKHENCDIALGSQSLLYFLQNEWGGDTLYINGRFEKPAHGNYKRFKRYADIRSFNNRSVPFPSLGRRLYNRLAPRLRLLTK